MSTDIMDTQELESNLAKLAELRERIIAAEFAVLGMRVEQGRILIAIKERTKHGEVEKAYIAAGVKNKARASEYMKVARLADTVALPDTLSWGVAIELTKDYLNQETVQDILAQPEMSVSAVKDVVKAHRPTKTRPTNTPVTIQGECTSTDDGDTRELTPEQIAALPETPALFNSAETPKLPITPEPTKTPLPDDAALLAKVLSFTAFQITAAIEALQENQVIAETDLNVALSSFTEAIALTGTEENNDEPEVTEELLQAVVDKAGSDKEAVVNLKRLAAKCGVAPNKLRAIKKPTSLIKLILEAYNAS